MSPRRSAWEAALESVVIGAANEFYRRYEGDRGRQRLAAAIRQGMGHEAMDAMPGPLHQ